jgi:hypothetical protein
MRAILTIIAIGCIGASGALAQQQALNWTKPDGTQEVFMQDRYACLQHTPQDSAGNYNVPTFVSCMVARGYQQDVNGDLFAPPDAQTSFERSVADYKQ